jgi:hypothetical protein
MIDLIAALSEIDLLSRMKNFEDHLVLPQLEMEKAFVR